MGGRQATFEFRPQLNRAEAISLAKRYSVSGDDEAIAAGRAIREGDFSRAHLGVIFKWKTNDRGKSRLAHNADAEVSDALKLSAAAEEPRSAIAVLAGLHGVGIPVASAVVAMVYPDVHTVLDYRALEALGNPTDDRSIDFYLSYRTFCFSLSADWSMSLRNLDRALWQWSKERTAKM